MSIDLSEALFHARAGRLRLDRCGEILQRKFARDFAARVARCFEEFRSRDRRLHLALHSIREWLRGLISSEGLAQQHRSLLSLFHDAFENRGFAYFMQVVEVFSPATRQRRNTCLQISAKKAHKAVEECLAELASLQPNRSADAAREAVGLFAYYKRPGIAIRDALRRYELVPAAISSIRDNELQWQCGHVARNLATLHQSGAVEMLRDHERGKPGARVFFWDWCEERGIDLCPPLIESASGESVDDLAFID